MKRETTTSRLLAAVLAVAMVASLWPQGAVRAADAAPDYAADQASQQVASSADDAPATDAAGASDPAEPTSAPDAPQAQDASANAANVKLTFKRATGIVSGTFDLWYEGTNAKGVKEQKSITGLKHEGVLVPMRGDDGVLEAEVLSSGFFVAPQKIKYYDAKGKQQTRTWNGSYRFDIKAVDVPREWSDAKDE